MKPKSPSAHTVLTHLMLLFASLLCSCVMAPVLRTQTANPAEVTGTFTVLLYGARYSDDIETVAILDREGDPYTFVIQAPEYDYKVIKRMNADEALSRATEFVSFHPSFRNAYLSRILDPAGGPIGFEVRPLYLPMEFGNSNVLDVQYRISDGTVTVWIELTPEVRRKKYDEDGPFLFRHRW
ncbi:MAG TPA: hypothetical protein VLD40_02245 [Dissulfurispiraceae bacterium]|nr:hypothetical protein [Dissulfurispiraceae bacterium]